MFIDTHTHSSGASYCSHITIEDLIDFKIELGYDGMILTNHVQPWYYKDRPFKAVIDDIKSDFERGLIHAENKNFKLILGAEISINLPRYSDILVYGDVPTFLEKHPDTCALTQRELYAACKENGMIMIQAHPKRAGFDFLEPSCLDGVEINCQPNDLALRDIVTEFAKQNNLILSCGTDTHARDMKTRGGLIVPDDISTCADYAKYLYACTETHLKINDEEFVFATKNH